MTVGMLRSPEMTPPPAYNDDDKNEQTFQSCMVGLDPATAPVPAAPASVPAPAPPTIINCTPTFDLDLLLLLKL